MYVHYDPEGDFLEIRFGKPKKSYYEEIGEDIFERRELKTGEVIGFALFNVKKRKEKSPLDIEVDLPTFAVI